MKHDVASQTALGTAAGRAVESRRSETDRLFEDRFASALLPPVLRGIVKVLSFPGFGAWLIAKRERQLPGIMGNLLCRTRFIDDALRDALKEGMDQVMILGAGLDSRAYRIPDIDEVRVFEVDHPATQAWKQKRLKKVLGTFPPHVTFVPIDFDRQELGSGLAEAGFRTEAKTFFIWEGVTQYITAEAVDATLQYLSCAAAAGSKAVFTYIHRGIIDGSVRPPGAEEIMSETQRCGEPWIFGIDPAELPQYLAARGFTLVEDVGASEYRVRYLEPLGRKMNIFEGERTVLAAQAPSEEER